MDSREQLKTRALSALGSLARAVTLDPRALSLARIALALVCLGDLWLRFGDLAAHYGPEGLLPEESYPLFLRPYHWSLHLYADLTLLKGLFFAQALAALSMMLGFRTRFSIFLLWVFTVSLQTRNPIIGNAGDALFRLIIFWMMFLPCDQYFSVEQKRRPSPLFDHPAVVGVASLALTCQFVLLYAISAAFKTHPCWMVTGKATEIALCLDMIVTPIGHWFKQHFLQVLDELTFAVVIWEAIAPAAFFFSTRTSWLRAIVIFGFMGMHLSFGLMMEVGVFSYVAIAGLIALLPSPLFQKLSPEEESPLEPSQNRALRAASYLLAAFVLYLLYSVVAWNLSGAKLKVPGFRVNSASKALVRTFRLEQTWNMFSPHPFLNDGWFEIPATYQDGTKFDLFWKGPSPLGKKPKTPLNGFPDARWRKYFMNIRRKKNRKYRPYLAQYLCRLSNENPGPNGRLVRLQIDYLMERTTLEAKELPTRRILIWKHDCEPKTETNDKPQAPAPEKTPEPSP